MWLTCAIVLWMQAGLAAWEPPRRQQREISDATAALNAGDAVSAEEMFRRVLSAAPDCGQAQHGLGMALLRQNRASEAAEMLYPLLDVHPEQPAAYTGASMVAFVLQDFQRAQTTAERGVQLDPTSVEALWALIAVLLRTGSYAEAEVQLASARGQIDAPTLSCLEIAVLVETRSVATARQRLAYCQQSVHTGLVASTAALLGEGTSQSAQLGAARLAQLQQAITDVNAGREQDAVVVLDALIAADARRADARLVRGKAHHALGNFPAARADLEVALQGDTWVDAHQNGSMSGIVRQSHEDALRAALAEGAGLLIEMQVNAGETAAARRRLQQARQQLGDAWSLDLAEARIQRAEGNEPAGWALVRPHLQQAVVLDAVGRWAIDRPAGVPEDILLSLSRSSRWQDQYNLAVVYYRRQAYAQCLQTVGASSSLPPQPSLLALGHRCAVFSEELPSADRFLAAVSRENCRDVDRANHARLLLQASRPEDALDALDGITDPAALPLSAAVALRAHVALGQWDAAVLLSASNTAADQYWLATQLVAMDRGSDALRLFSQSCSQLDEPQRSDCQRHQQELSPTP